MSVDYSAQAERIRAAYTTAVDKIRARHKAGAIGTPARDHQLAKALRDAQAQLDALQRDEQAQIAARTRQLNRRLFGLGEHAAGATVLAHRDALDRAARLTDPAEAKRLLARAERTGDDLLAQAVAHHAAENRWSDVIDAYLRERPQHVDAYTELVAIKRHQNSPQARFHQTLGYVVPAPSELAGYNDTRLDHIASHDPGADL